MDILEGLEVVITLDRGYLGGVTHYFIRISGDCGLVGLRIGDMRYPHMRQENTWG